MDSTNQRIIGPVPILPPRVKAGSPLLRARLQDYSHLKAIRVSTLVARCASSGTARSATATSNPATPRNVDRIGGFTFEQVRLAFTYESRLSGGRARRVIETDAAYRPGSPAVRLQPGGQNCSARAQAMRPPRERPGCCPKGRTTWRRHRSKLPGRKRRWWCSDSTTRLSVNGALVLNRDPISGLPTKMRHEQEFRSIRGCTGRWGRATQPATEKLSRTAPG